MQLSSAIERILPIVIVKISGQPILVTHSGKSESSVKFNSIIPKLETDLSPTTCNEKLSILNFFLAS